MPMETEVGAVTEVDVAAVVVAVAAEAGAARSGSGTGRRETTRRCSCYCSRTRKKCLYVRKMPGSGLRRCENVPMLTCPAALVGLRGNPSRMDSSQSLILLSGQNQGKVSLEGNEFRRGHSLSDSDKRSQR